MNKVLNTAPPFQHPSGTEKAVFPSEQAKNTRTDGNQAVFPSEQAKNTRPDGNQAFFPSERAQNTPTGTERGVSVPERGM